MMREDVLALNVSTQLAGEETSGRRWRRSLSNIVWSARELVKRDAWMARKSQKQRVTWIPMLITITGF